MTVPDVPQLRLDLRGLKCPLPSLRIRKALAGLADGAWLEALCTDPMAAIDVPVLLRESGDRLEDMREENGVLLLRIRKQAISAAPGAKPADQVAGD